MLRSDTAVVEVEVEVEVEGHVVAVAVDAVVGVEVELDVLVAAAAVAVVLVAVFQVLLYVQVIQVVVFQGWGLGVEDGVPMGFGGLFSQDDQRSFHLQFLVKKGGCWQ